MKKIIVITGPTASGKTDLALKLANIFKGEIINADSVQIYKEFNIGSSKVAIQETQILHHLIDIVTPESDYNIYHYQKDVRKIIQGISIPFLVGGSGLYIKAALFNYELEETANNKIVLNNDKNDKATLEMLNEIKKKDPNLILDEHNPHRIVSAYKQLNQKKLRSQKKGKNLPLFNILTIYLDIEKTILKQRIIIRLENMLKKGLIKEVQNIQKNYPRANLNIIGYREIKNFLDQKITLQKAKELIIKNTLQYAKRQKTWFQNQMKSLIMVDAVCKNLEEETTNIIGNFLKQKD
ncbi:MAG: tRNA (adenosine(37)-N6)-dimethylallyltransferase MiaA [Weeping tea tree witches'-broom phytoplasma]|uniref:tRNA (adenosine(37)-N6)-dimethylallyltransferase MiaA n=1 Tax=Candidatus Phytoplasma melaleucae TaxID=2982630 RepID=UPI00293AD712|nr:tRNA (adenosine(37)-N6)-dimethylallyltransferase MiaA [Weeping tea tree witches'-broom phytoplasma]